MKNLTTLILQTVFLLSIYHPVSSQNDCNPVLTGLYDFTNIEMDDEFWKRYVHEIDIMKFSTNKKFEEYNKSLGVTIPIESIPVNFSFNNNGKVQTNTKNHNTFREFWEEEVQIKRQYKFQFKKVSEPVVKAWIDCISKNRIKYWYVRTDSLLTVYIQRGIASHPPTLKISAVNYDEDNLTILPRSRSNWFYRMLYGEKTTDYSGEVISGENPYVIRFKIKNLSKDGSYVDVYTNSDDLSAKQTIRPIIPDPEVINDIKPEPIEICSCMCGDGLEGNKFWGPKGEYGCGNSRYGKYENECRNLIKIGSGSATKGGLSSFIVWGPIGEPVLGNPEYGTYGTVEVTISKTKVEISNVLSYCKGAAAVNGGFAGLEFWGPKGYNCLGVGSWPIYDSGQNCFD